VSEGSRIIPNGKFTISSARSGQHRTFRIRTAKGGQAKGARFVDLLTGPDNQTNYKAFAIVSDNWQHIYVFKTMRADKGQKPTEFESFACMLECMLTGKAIEHYEELGYTISGSRKCARCGRELTEPESIRIGLGPECLRFMDR